MDWWTNSCRSCLKRAEGFSHFIYEHITPQQYFNCTSVWVKRDDRLPKAMCGDCYNLINKFVEFKMRCIVSDNKLMTLSQGLILKEEPCSDVEVNNEMEAEDTWKEEGVNEHKTEMRTNFIKIEIDVSKEHEAEEVLSNVKNDVTTDAPNTDLEDFEEHIDATQVSATELTKSKARIVLPKNFKCEQCNKRFSFKERLEGHMLTHEGKTELIQCKECNKTLTTWGGLRRHTESCHGRLSFKDVTCQVCFKVCKTPDTLRVHMRTHEERRERVCDECGKTFKSDVTFKNHLETHTTRTRNHPCQYCGKHYINTKTRASHISRRHANKQFICAYCAFVFTDKANLIRHIMKHEDRHPKYKCDVCPRVLTSQASLKIHKRIHTGEKPFSCSHCGKSFSDRARMVEHERNHTGEKPFECAVCALRFSRRGSMRRHMKVHNMWAGCKRKGKVEAVREARAEDRPRTVSRCPSRSN